MHSAHAHPTVYPHTRMQRSEPCRDGGGRFGERREYEAPTLPSTPRQHGAARHHKSRARNSRP